MDNEPASSVASHPNRGRRPTTPAGKSVHQQRAAALDERERRLDLREDQIARREHTNDLRDLTANRHEVDEDLYPGMDD